jgi:hypothetical protein
MLMPRERLRLMSVSCEMCRSARGVPLPGIARRPLSEDLHHPQGRLGYGPEPERQCQK